ncbi:unnamed protein product [Phaedon cochleariae]|uniref:Mitochondrial pyruvate carrier n=1 Tax=Phaedon cochleariae TaxID=80249 RepID=A0A9P0DGM4_PHACE|nr:unnamed protein product [Phaedon cochleariae]
MINRVVGMYRLLRYPGCDIIVETQKKYITDRYDHLVPKKLIPLWHHPAGPQTIFFWAPAFKWGLVVASISDLGRHPSLISAQQCASLAIAGLIWSRYSLVITPRSWFLFSVNFFVGFTQSIQLIRVLMYQASVAGTGGDGK